MKKYFIYTLIIAFVATFSFTGCKEDTGGTENASYELLTNYLKTQNMDIDKIITNADGAKFVMGAPADGDVSGKWVMDIRSAADFAAGHIAAAHNVDFTDILTTAATADKPILVVCYTGQTACYATSLLRLYGYSDAQALKWGMSGWNPTFDKWTANCKDLTDASNWTTSETAAQTYGTPTITTSLTEGEAILKERVEQVVAAGFQKISSADVLANPGNYHINNYFSADHYSGFGHINGAVRILPILLADGSINKLDPAKEIVTYCYTGQTSAIVTAYLNVLGYNAKSLLFGINGMSTSNSFWTSGNVTNHWGHDSNPKNLSFE